MLNIENCLPDKGISKPNRALLVHVFPSIGHKPVRCLGDLV